MNFDRFELLSLISAFWRRRWYLLASAWLVSLLGWAVIVILPDKYESEARVYIDTSSLLGPLLRGIAIANNVEREVAFMQRTLLSRPNLQEVARATDLDLEVTTPIELEEGALEIPCHFFKLKKRNDTCEMTLILRPPFLPCKTART
jgi:uncharacterized protein involved in exopolysaccharide biosynthesis